MKYAAETYESTALRLLVEADTLSRSECALAVAAAQAYATLALAASK